jgi:hypothetical protein
MDRNALLRLCVCALLPLENSIYGIRYMVIELLFDSVHRSMSVSA